LRPTLGRVRETLFNWLREDVEGSRCLDLFAGSGALGFEALSRGAACRDLRRQPPRGGALLRGERRPLGADGRRYVICCAAERVLRRAGPLGHHLRRSAVRRRICLAGMLAS
jgi:16S rRNA (guanine966-N2)-methyltransferase